MPELVYLQSEHDILEVAMDVLFLASDDGSFVNAENLVVDAVFR